MTRVLIVEDDPVQARALARSFAKLRPDFTILTSSNGVEATRLMSERVVDLVLTDLQMPEMDGFQLLAWILNNCPDVSVFTMSGYDSYDTARLTTLGAIDSFTKPVNVEVAMARLTDALAQSVRGHVQNVSLASFLQLLEMERKSCDLKVACDEKNGVLVVRKGVLLDARCEELRGEQAAIQIVAWPYPGIAICRPSDAVTSTIQKPLGFILMEAMRVQDESARDEGHATKGNGSIWPAPRRTRRPSAAPPSDWSGLADPKHANGEVRLPSGAQAIALVETASGAVLRSAATAGCPLTELAAMAAQVLRQQVATLRMCADGEGVEELVLTATSRCDVIRPLGPRDFALLVFAPEDTNLAMARLELEQFVARCAQRTP